MSDLVVYNQHVQQLRATVAHIETVEEAKDLADKAAAAQVWARRVRLGQDAVNHAAEIRVRAERRAGELLSFLNGSTSGRVRVLPDDVSHRQSHEWQALADIPEPDFDAALEAEKADGALTRTGVTRRAMDVHYSSSSPEWSTPQDLFDELHREFDFQLDVCATDVNAKCAMYFTEAEDGLAQPWTGRCWMNPPYGELISRWVEKAHEAARTTADLVVCLVPARVDTGWWWDHCRFGEIRLLRGRLKFGGGTVGAPFPSAVVIFGREPNALAVHWERG